LRAHYYFSRVAAPEVVPALIELMTKQDEDASDDEWNISRAAYTCLQLFSQSTRGEIAQLVLQFVERFLPDQDWHKREAAVSAFGAVLHGPDQKMLENMVKQGLPFILQKMQDENFHVRDAAAYALGRICEFGAYAVDPATQLQPLLEALFAGIQSEPKMAQSCCWALINIANNFGALNEEETQSNPLSPHFSGTVAAVLAVTEKSDANNTLRVAAYEVLNAFVSQAANDSLPTVAKLLDVIIQRLESTIPLQQQVVSVEDKMTLEEIQTSVTSCLMSIIQRLSMEIKPQADRIMTVLLNLLSNVGQKSSVPDIVFGTIGILASSIEEDFIKYMESFAPFLNNALGNHEEPSLCAMAIGLVSDITRSLGEKAQPFCDSFMNQLLSCLNVSFFPSITRKILIMYQSAALGDQVKPAILQCFGDIAQAIGLHFETYLSVVARVLQQAASIDLGPDTSIEHDEYVLSLREGCMDAWSGIILAMKDKAQALAPFVELIFPLLNSVWTDGDRSQRSDGLRRSAMGVIG
jgi:importin subunit beta-1